MPYPYFTSDDLEDRLSRDVVRQILDDNNDGAADANAVDRLLKDASSKVASYLRGTYDLDAVKTNTPNEVVRLALDVAEALAARRHPEHVKGKDWEKLMRAVESDLTKLRNGVTRLDVIGTPEPAKNVGVQFASGDPNKPELPPRFSDDFGDF